MAKMASTFRAILILKRRDAASTKVKDDIPFESFMDLRNAPLSGSSELFPKEAVEKAIEKSSQVFHDKAIRKTNFQGKPAKKSTRRLQFFQSSQQPSLRSILLPSPPGSRLVGVRLRPLHPALRLLPPLTGMGGGRSFEGFWSPSQPWVGGVLKRHLAS